MNIVTLVFVPSSVKTTYVMIFTLVTYICKTSNKNKNLMFSDVSTDNGLWAKPTLVY